MSQHTLGERIKFHRTRLHLTQEQLAQKLGVSPQAVSKWEHDQSCPDISVLPDLANLFGISIDELLGKTSDERVHQAEVVDEKSGPTVTWNWQPAKKSSILFAIYILTIGGLMLMNNICGFDVSWWSVTWTMAVAFIGVGGLLKGFSLFSLVLSLSGVYFLLSKYELFSVDFKWSYVFPALLLLWGVSLLIDVLVKKKSIVTAHYKPSDSAKAVCECTCEGGYLNCDLSIGSHRSTVSTECLRGGNIDTSFGQFVIDFSGCKTAAQNCVLNVDHSFGSLTLLFPKHLLVEVMDNDNSFGSANIEGTPDSVTFGTVFLKLDNSFGTIHVRYVE